MTAGCSQVAVKLSNFHPETRDKTLLLDKNVLTLDVPKKLRGLDFKKIKVNVSYDKINPPEIVDPQVFFKVKEEAVTENKNRLVIDISSNEWKAGKAYVAFYSMDRKLYELSLDLRHNLILPGDY